MVLSDRAVLPLTGSTFEPGNAEKVIKEMEDKESAQIALAEYYYFSANAELCAETVKPYLSQEDIMLRLSADMLYTFANLTIGDSKAAQQAREDIQRCMVQVVQENATMEQKASCLFAYYVTNIFLHITPEKKVPPFLQYIPYLPTGQRLFAISLLAHETYLRQEYARAKGLVQRAFLMADTTYPIPIIYLNCVQAMCQINLKEQKEAIHSVNSAWEMARPDRFWEPFIEYHGLLQGLLEVCVRKKEPEIYKQLAGGIISFSRSWMKIHNPKMQKTVTDLLSPLEFSIAMLACRNWTNQEIAEYLGFSINTVKHYVSGILEKLGIDKRDKIKNFVNQ